MNSVSSSNAVLVRWITPDVRRLKIDGGEWLRWPGQPWEFHPSVKRFGAAA